MNKINPKIFSKIQKRLKNIEKEYDLQILFAIESGSRAWGFESRDSDYDIRFVYAHKKDHYLSIREKRDVIEYPIIDLIDINGWDIKKALQLFSKFNPVLGEWLKSPITYMEQTDFRKELLDFEVSNFSAKNSLYHYLNMARGNYREYLKSDFVKIKKYFYVLRPLLACMWIEKHNSAPPIVFMKLFEDGDNIDAKLKKEILNLLKRKISCVEMGFEPRVDIINKFIEEKINHFENYTKNIESKSVDIEKLDEFFKNYIL